MATSVTDVFTEISNPGKTGKQYLPSSFASLLAGYLITLIYNLPVAPETSCSAEFNRQASATSGSCLFDPPGEKLLSYTFEVRPATSRGVIFEASYGAGGINEVSRSGRNLARR